MKVKMFSIYDSKAEAYNNPFYHTNRNTALRGWMDAIEKDPMFAKHGADYTLFEIGEYDTVSGKVECYGAKVNLGTALELGTKIPSVLPAEKTSPGLISKNRQMDLEDVPGVRRTITQ